MTERPAPPDEDVAASGFAWIVVPEEDETTLGWHRWTTSPAIVDGRWCRWGSPRGGYCGRPASAALDRGSGRPKWYGYCDDPTHLYGRWIEDGKVVGWRLRRVG